MFVKRCLLMLAMIFLCQDVGLGFRNSICRFGAFGQNATDTLVVTVSAAPGPGQELLKELIKSQNATLRVTDSRGTPLRGATEDGPQGPAPLGPRLGPKTGPSPTAEPVEPGRRCPRGTPSPKPPSQNGTDTNAEVSDEVITTNRVEECTAQCSDAEGVEETVNVCDEGCDGDANKTQPGSKDFDKVVEGGNEVALEADADEKKAPPPCKKCKSPSDTAPAANKVTDPCGGTKDGNKVAGPCRPAEDQDRVPPKVQEAVGAAVTMEALQGAATEPPKGAATEPPKEAATEAPAEPTGAEKMVEVRVEQEPQCRISLEEETQVNADCRSCSARVLSGGGVKLSCFQCEHRPADQTCFFARKVGAVGKNWEHSYVGPERGYCAADRNLTRVIENMMLDGSDFQSICPLLRDGRTDF